MVRKRSRPLVSPLAYPSPSGRRIDTWTNRLVMIPKVNPVTKEVVTVSMEPPCRLLLTGEGRKERQPSEGPSQPSQRGEQQQRGAREEERDGGGEGRIMVRE
jgi:hypothetical protein